jgi:hypothetical protein
MGLFKRRVPSYQPLRLLPWDEARVLLVTSGAQDDATYLVDQVERSRRSRHRWADAVEATRDLAAALTPMLLDRCEVDDLVVRQALASGWLLAQEDVEWGTGQRTGEMHVSAHNGLCLLRHQLPEHQLVAGSKALEAGYYLGRTGADPSIIATGIAR